LKETTPVRTGKKKEELKMKKGLIVTVAMLAVCSFATSAPAEMKKDGKINGAEEFKNNCAVCHPNGGNIINPKKPLDKKTLAENKIKSAKDIIAKMRNPGPGMTKFDKKTIPDKEAKAIAEYILKTFK
jgi:cytochrome c6